MRVVVAADKFKATASSHDVFEAVREGIMRVAPHTHVAGFSLADGGDGSVDAALAAGFTRVSLDVSGPLTGSVTANAAVRESADAQTSVIEVANTCGLNLVGRASEDSALRASSRGFGEALASRWGSDARMPSDHGPIQRIVAAIGGSSSTDAGAGVLEQLGITFIDANGQAFTPTGGSLTDVHRVRIGEEFTRFRTACERGDVDLVIASDVTNPLLGPSGAAAVFGPQKGASPAIVQQLEAGLAHLVDVLNNAGLDARECAQHPGAGAAGGIGFALMLAGGRTVSGAEFFLDLLDFSGALEATDLVITGEGSLDHQTLNGKLPQIVAQRARAAGVAKVAAVAGRVTISDEQARSMGLDATYSLGDIAQRPTVGNPEATRHALTLAGAQIATEMIPNPL